MTRLASISSTVIDQERQWLEFNISNNSLIIGGKKVFFESSSGFQECKTLWKIPLNKLDTVEILNLPLDFKHVADKEVKDNNFSLLKSILEFTKDESSQATYYIDYFIYNTNYATYILEDELFVWNRDQINESPKRIQLDDWVAPFNFRMRDSLITVIKDGEIIRITDPASNKVYLRSIDIIEVWDLDNQEMLGRLKSNESLGVYAILSTDNSLFATQPLVGKKHTLIWNLNSFDLQSDIPTAHTLNSNMIFSDDNILYISNNYSISAWDVYTNELLFNTEIQTTQGTRIALHPSENILAVGMSNGELKLYDSLSGIIIATTHVADIPIRDIKFSPNGKFLALAFGGDGAVQLWEVSGDK